MAAPRSIGGVDLAARSPRKGGTLSVEDIQVGQKLPDAKIEISTTLIVGGAFYTLDYADGHDDRDAAREHGLQDIIINIRTTAGLCQRFITDFTGPESRLKSFNLRLGAQNYPHDTMVMSGHVLALDPVANLVGIQFAGHNQFGVHAEGIAVVELLPAQ